MLNRFTEEMVGVAQRIEHQVVALRAVGSSPITHPNIPQWGVAKR